MKYLRLALMLLPLMALCVHAADDDEKEKQDEIPNFDNLDEYIYQPKSSAVVGFRYISGAKTSFWGNGTIPALEATPDATAPNISRTYHDGYVSPDGRVLSVDNGDGTSSTVPIVPDGKTNTWSYLNPSQVTSDDYMQMHIYSAVTEDTTDHIHPAHGNSGVELSTSRDMGNLGGHFSWSLFGGVSVNDLQSATYSAVQAQVTTITDTYDLFGQVPPAGPYTAPSNTTQYVVDANGNDVTNSVNGEPIQQKIDNTTLLGNVPLTRTTVPVVDDTSVVNHYKLHGAYTTFRGGPALNYNFNDHLKFYVSAGPALIYASSLYQVTEVLTPMTGSQLINVFQNIEAKFLPAVYADATMEYHITDRTGIYFGAFFQDSGNYVQTISGLANFSTTSTGTYSTRVDFSNQQGLRTGMTVKF